MKKIIISLMFFVIVIGLVGCSKKKVSVDAFRGYLESTEVNYADSESGNVLVTINDGTKTTKMEFIYNYNTSNIESFMIILTSGESVMEGYVKDGFDYTNVNGEKTKASLNSDKASTIVKDYNFETVTEQVFKTFDQSLFNAFNVKSDADGVVTMEFDKSKYVLNTEGLDGDDLVEASERYEQIKENIKSITLVLNYSGEKVTKLESTWVTNEDITKTLNVEFRGFEGKQTITYPADLDSYAPRA